MTAPVAPPPSRRLRKKRRTREQIYDAARSLFARDGFDAVTVEAICARADVAKGTFFLHFPTKGALLFEYSKRLAAELEPRIAAHPGDAAEAFRALTRALVDDWLAHAELTAPMLRELLRDPSALARAPVEGRDLANLLIEVVRRGQARGDFRSDIAPELAAQVFLSSSLAFLAGALQAETPLGPEAIRDQFLELVLHGLVAPSEKPS
jgi:AcrR family transcriptional regulator